MRPEQLAILAMHTPVARLPKPPDFDQGILSPVVPTNDDRFDRSKWPLGARLVARFAAQDDRGVGDTIKRELGRAGKAFSAAVKLLGIECGCPGRQAAYNQRWPYRSNLEGV